MRKLSMAGALGAVCVAALVAVSLSSGSSHREAPNIMLDPSADNTDTYAFTANDAPDKLTVVATWVPGGNPAISNRQISVKPIAWCSKYSE